MEGERFTKTGLYFIDPACLLHSITTLLDALLLALAFVTVGDSPSQVSLTHFTGFRQHDGFSSLSPH